MGGFVASSCLYYTIPYYNILCHNILYRTIKILMFRWSVGHLILQVLDGQDANSTGHGPHGWIPRLSVVSIGVWHRGYHTYRKRPCMLNIWYILRN